MKAVLTLPSFRRLLVSYTLNELAWAVANLALSLLVYRRTGSAWASTGFFLASQFLPAFIAPGLVARVHHLDRRRCLVALYGLQALVFVALAAAPSHFHLAPVLGLVLVGGSLGLAARPILRSATSRVISPAGLLREGNAITNTAFALAILVGPLMGSELVGAGGSAATLFTIAGIFLVMALGLTGPQAPAEDLQERSRVRIRTSLAHASGDPRVRRLLILQAVALVFFTITTPVEVVLAERSLHAGTTGYAVLLSVWGSGAVLGSAVYARWRQAPGWVLIGLGSALIGVGFLIMAVAPSIVMASVGAAIGGVGNGIEAVAERTTLQEAVDQRWMAVMLSLNDSMSQACPGLGLLLGGALTALATPRLAFIVGGVGALGIGTLAPVVLRSIGPAEVPGLNGDEGAVGWMGAGGGEHPLGEGAGG